MKLIYQNYMFNTDELIAIIRSVESEIKAFEIDKAKRPYRDNDIRLIYLNTLNASLSKLKKIKPTK
jgi:hypothetical protein